jgi:tRNA nucleotidyltransferase (CCA-adding enzyme)
MLDEEVLYIKRRTGNMRVLSKRADFRSRWSDHPHICVQTEMMLDVIPHYAGSKAWLDRVAVGRYCMTLRLIVHDYGARGTSGTECDR